jgi:hypothetical protein
MGYRSRAIGEPEDRAANRLFPVLLTVQRFRSLPLRIVGHRIFDPRAIHL